MKNDEGELHIYMMNCKENGELKRLHKSTIYLHLNEVQREAKLIFIVVQLKMAKLREKAKENSRFR